MSFSSLVVWYILIFLFTITAGESDPCFRECSENPTSFKTCVYNFTVEDYWVLSSVCGLCPSNLTDCETEFCIPADGYSRRINVVNRLLPGPSIHVCTGDIIVVNVHNMLMGEGTTIHFHGIRQKNTPWYDGVPGVTQCPILPGSHFRYEIEADRDGTYFWHSHSILQRGDGVFGPLIIRRPKYLDPHASLYDYDLVEHEISVMDWTSDISTTVMLKMLHARGKDWTNHALINGRGFPPLFFKDIDRNKTMKEIEKTFIPPFEVRVKRGSSYRLRLISNGVNSCPFIMSIENHDMLVIAADGNDIKPIAVESIVLHSGMRWDIVLNANQTIGSYWIKFQGDRDCEDTKNYQLAVLNYDEMPVGSLPKYPIWTWKEAAPTDTNGIMVDPLCKVKDPFSSTHIPVTKLSALVDDDVEIIERVDPDYQFYLQFFFYPIDNTKVGTPLLSNSFEQLRVKRGYLFAPKINHITNFLPTPPLLLDKNLKNTSSCTPESLANSGKNCSEEFCECTYLNKLNLNSIVEVIIVDYGYSWDKTHPFHLHGNDFRVVATEYLGNKTIVDIDLVKDMDKKGLIRRERKNAVIKDTVTVPDGGFTIIRFRASNPGFWLFHCHISFHTESGMSLVFQVGDTDEFPKIPENFPTCS